MSIQSNFEYKGVTYDKVTFKIVRVFGSKAEGWNAVFTFVADGDDFVEKNFKGLISVGSEWLDTNPYPVLYGKMEEILKRGGFNCSNDIEIASSENPHVNSTLVRSSILQAIKEEVESGQEEPKPKKTRTKKVKKNAGDDLK